MMKESHLPEKDLYKIMIWTLAGSSLVFIAGWFINIMDIDASQYASITREMLARGDYLTFTDRGKEYLDKPPLLFWVSGISMKLFGINNVAYRIPAFLATLLALYATYRLAVLYYDKSTGYLAVVILATLQAVFLINHDVRTDTNLMCFFIVSLWQLAEFMERKKAVNFIIAFTAIGMAMLAKGPIGLIAPGLGVFMHLVIRKDWKNLFNPVWLLGLVIVAVVLVPMSYGLYEQFDMHPEKVVNGQTGVSGLRFFYWTQSFGRITGESIWENDTGPFFLSHSTLWAFAPWSLLLVLGLIRETRIFIRHVSGKESQREFLILFGFLLPFMALSSSRYQLPHYAFIVYPLGAIMAAKYIISAFYSSERPPRLVYYVQTTIILLALILVFFLAWFSFQDYDPVAAAFYIVAIVVFGYVAFLWKNVHTLVVASVLMILLANLAMNVIFYPSLLKYQAGSEIAKRALEEGASQGSLYSYKTPVTGSMDFYANMTVPIEQDIDTLAARKNVWVYTSEEFVAEIIKKRPDASVVFSTGDYSVTQLTGEFLNPATRESTLRRRYLIKL
jgi:4-amino-4-deoxy-L-arabinose transferase-like glycosyltransferase